MHINHLDDRFSVTGQIRPDQAEALARDGCTLIRCNRPNAKVATDPRRSDQLNA